jgi:hypothetical protein
MDQGPAGLFAGGPVGVLTILFVVNIALCNICWRAPLARLLPLVVALRSFPIPAINEIGIAIVAANSTDRFERD